MEEAKARVSETELRKQMDDFAAMNGGPIDLFYRITSVRPPSPALCWLWRFCFSRLRVGRCRMVANFFGRSRLPLPLSIIIYRLCVLMCLVVGRRLLRHDNNPPFALLLAFPIPGVLAAAAA